MGVCLDRRRARRMASARLEVAMQSAFQEKFPYIMVMCVGWGLSRWQVKWVVLLLFKHSAKSSIAQEERLAASSSLLTSHWKQQFSVSVVVGRIVIYLAQTSFAALVTRGCSSSICSNRTTFSMNLAAWYISHRLMISKQGWLRGGVTAHS